LKHIVSFSGGLGSAITADMVCKKYGKDNVTLLFADTLIEDKDLYTFNRDVVELLGCDFVTICEGRTPWQVFNDVKYIGNTRVDPCSKVLKRDFIRKYITSNHKPEDCVIWIGIDCTEEHRLNPVVLRNNPYSYRSILIENDIFLTNEYKFKWLTDNNITVPRMYKMGFSHHNCGGFCVKAGLGQFKKLWEMLPDVYTDNEREEQLAIKKNPNLKHFLRKTINGKLTYISMRDYRINYLEKNLVSVDENNEFGGCGCAL
jgi:hypothetical protein